MEFSLPNYLRQAFSYSAGKDHISHQWEAGNSSSQLLLDGICYGSREGVTGEPLRIPRNLRDP